MTKYDGAHRNLRRRLRAQVEAGKAICWRCQKPIRPGQAWHLGHDDSGQRWIGPEHARCNTSAAGKVGRAVQLARGKREPAKPRFDGLPDPEPANMVERWSRHWGGGFNPRCPDCRRLRRACDAAEADA